MVSTLKLRPQRMAKLVAGNYAAATELANFLVRERKLPFRDCHRIVGHIVGTLIDEQRLLTDYGRVGELLAEEGQDVSEQQLAEILDAQAILHRQVSEGSTGVEATAAIIEQLHEAIADNHRQVAQRHQALTQARQQTDQIIKHILEGGELAVIEL